MQQHPQAVLDYFARIGAVVLNYRRAMVKVYKKHYYYEKALIKIAPDGNVTSSMEEYAPTAEEAAAMKSALEGVVFPCAVEARSTLELRRSGRVSGELFEFFNRATGGIIMAQERRPLEGGAKAYIPWVLLDTGEWVAMEPDGALPFWKPQAGTACSRFMIHEGAKAARFVSALLEDGGRDHPWAEELANYEHWGMIGGALAPHRTNYDELRALNPTEVVYVCDNDYTGNSAMRKVSRKWERSMKGVVFGTKFPVAWDMADPLPAEMFAATGRFIGPALKALTRAATWATELVPADDKRKRPAVVLRHYFAEDWMHAVTPEVYVHRDWPNRLLSLQEFNNEVAPFSDADDTARLLKRDAANKAQVLKYLPNEPPGLHGEGYINTFQPSEIKPEPGDLTPWYEFMTHLVPDEGDRRELMRWCATLIARPDVKMGYGVLLISETQGVGKGTLGEKILTPLLGEDNVSCPSEQELVDSQYNYWLAHKRLAVVHEIYAGHSNKAYDRLKPWITEKLVTVQKKYQANYTLQNWVHLFACSNSMRALNIPMDDRRWLVPELTEEKRSQAYWRELNGWLTTGGGLGAIRAWADEFLAAETAVGHGADAPSTKRKRDMVMENYSPGQTIVARVLRELADRIETGELDMKQVFVTDTALIELIKQELWDGRHNDRLERARTIRLVAKAMNWHIGKERVFNLEWGVSNRGGRVLTLCPALAERNPLDLLRAGLRPVELTNGSRM